MRLTRPVAASSNILFKGLPSRRLPFGLYWNDEMKENQMDRTYTGHGRGEKDVQNCNLKT